MTKCLHPRVRAIQRSRLVGKNLKPMTTVGAAAYMNRMDLHQEPDRFLQEEEHNFSHLGKEHVIAQGILAPSERTAYLRDVDPADKELYREVTERFWNDAEHAGESQMPSQAGNGPSRFPQSSTGNRQNTWCADSSPTTWSRRAWWLSTRSTSQA